MVYDLGGGTFDVSIIGIGDGVIERFFPPMAIPILACRSLLNQLSSLKLKSGFTTVAAFYLHQNLENNLHARSLISLIG